jgi:hypothetical protein
MIYQPAGCDVGSSVRRWIGHDAAEEAAAARDQLIGQAGAGQPRQVSQRSPATVHLTQHPRDSGGATEAPARGLDDPYPAVGLRSAQFDALE